MATFQNCFQSFWMVYCNYSNEWSDPSSGHSPAVLLSIATQTAIKFLGAFYLLICNRQTVRRQYNGAELLLSLLDAGSHTTSARANQEQVVGEYSVGSTSISSRPRLTIGRAATTRATRPATFLLTFTAVMWAGEAFKVAGNHVNEIHDFC